ncbi:MAG TPA: type IX secretion system sortase PorU [Ignavibacteria bacterium]|nr:type IX secretion system sortase PorU [Ignavibacteria bacterium]
MKINKIVLILSFFVVVNLNAQDKNQLSKTQESPVQKTDDYVPDFKVISSNNSYIELEFTPQYIDRFNFKYSRNYGEQTGKPDVQFKTLPVFLPSPKDNRIEIIDYKYEDVQNVDINPVPTIKRGKEEDDWKFDYIKDPKAYGENSFYPKNAADFKFGGIMRNKYVGSIFLNPVLYNPVTKTARKYTYLRVRVVFSGSPLYTKRIQDAEELGLMQFAALNFDVAKNWSTREELQQTDAGIENSIFASGDFYRIEVKQTGIYKIDKAFLQNAGINVANINPKTFKIYGNGGHILPYNNSDPVALDPVENAIFVAGENDGQFNDDDYILFYGKSQSDWSYDDVNKQHYHYINPYSASNYYFISFGGADGKRMETVASPNVPGAAQLTQFWDRFFENPDVNNLGATGTVWVSQRIDNGNGMSFNKELRGYVQNSDINLRMMFGNASIPPATFELKDENSSYYNLIGIPGIWDEFSHINFIYPALNVFYNLGSNTSTRLRLSLPSSHNSNTVAGYLDYYEIHYPRMMSADNNFLRFNSPDTNAMMEFRVSSFNSSEVKVFDVTVPYNTALINPVSFNQGTVVFQKNIQLGTPSEFYTIGNNYLTPGAISAKLNNQNLKGFSEGASFIILSPTEFLSAANTLKAYRETPGPNYIKTHVVDINQIYNEFSAGLQDPVAIRNYIKYAYNNWNIKPVHILFFADGSYDFRNLYNLNTKNYLPPFQLDRLDQNEIFSYCSDDFSVEINENYPYPNSATVPDFSWGRLCVNSLQEANDVVSKIICYENPANYGIWKKKIMYVADDGWTTTYTNGEEGALHTSQCEIVAEQCTPPDFEKDKVYLVNYPAIYTPQGRRKPGVNEAIIKGWNEGRLVINYVGHGSTDLWAHEQVFDRQVSIPQLNNGCKLPFVTIASCDLARYDDPFFISAAEQLVNKPNGGAIGVIAAVRPVYSGPNAAFNEELWRNFMFKKDTLNLPIRIGSAVYNTKNVPGLSGDNTLKFTLISDPTLRVAIPQYFTRIDSINNVPGTETAQIKALQKVSIYGSVLRTDSTFWDNYNGNINMKVFDVDRFVTVFDFGIPFNFRLDGGTIFNGNASVTNGKWKIEFVVPRDISYDTGHGKIITYFNNSGTDGSGYTNKFFLNGIDSNAAVDTVGPRITLYMDSRNFRSGDMLNQNTKIIADFFDENGMNLTGTIGHKIEAVINNNENNKIDLTQFYNSTTNYQNGTLEYALNNLADGNYSIKLRAFDTYNNVGETQVDFTVTSNKQLTIENIYNYPNPMKDMTNFLFQHNFDVPLNVDIRIYTVSGRLIKELNKENISDKFVQIEWDGKDADGDAIANGTYIYRLVVKSSDGNFNANSTGKLAVLK